MNEADRQAALQQSIAKAQRAQVAWDEFFAPMLTKIKAEYADRIVTVATTELNPAKRADKLTALSDALKITNALEGGMLAIIRDGEMAFKEVLGADKIERMTAPQRRLFNMAPR